MRALAAVLAGALVWWLADRALVHRHGPAPATARPRPRLGHLPQWPRPGGRGRAVPGGPVWLAEAGAGVGPAQFWSSCGLAGGAGFIGGEWASGTVVLGVLTGLAAAGTPFAYWAARRQRLVVARAEAWPDAVRFMVGALGAGTATLHDAMEALAVSGPPALRPYMERTCRLASHLGDARALETVRGEMADPVSDPVMLALVGASEEGTATAVRVLEDLGGQISADLALRERARTVQAQSRAAVWACLVLPYLVLAFLCGTNPAYRAFFSTSGGAFLVAAGAVTSLCGFAASRRLVRPLSTQRRVFAGGRPS